MGNKVDTIKQIWINQVIENYSFQGYLKPCGLLYAFGFARHPRNKPATKENKPT